MAGDAKKIYELEKQLELAQMIVKLAHGHMWSFFAERTCNVALEMQREIQKEIEKEKKELIQ